MTSSQFAEGLVKLGFEKQNPRTRREHQIYTMKKWSVWFETQRNGMWVWIDKGQKIIRTFVKSEEESIVLLNKLTTVIEKTA